jgi:hypothetical protein
MGFQIQMLIIIVYEMTYDFMKDIAIAHESSETIVKNILSVLPSLSYLMSYQ